MKLEMLLIPISVCLHCYPQCRVVDTTLRLKVSLQNIVQSISLPLMTFLPTVLILIPDLNDTLGPGCPHYVKEYMTHHSIIQFRWSWDHCWCFWWWTLVIMGILMVHYLHSPFLMTFWIHQSPPESRPVSHFVATAYESILLFEMLAGVHITEGFLEENPSSRCFFLFV